MDKLAELKRQMEVLEEHLKKWTNDRNPASGLGARKACTKISRASRELWRLLLDKKADMKVE